MIERPSYIAKIDPFVGKDVIKVLVGVRRSGKSTLLMQVKDMLLSRGVTEQQVMHLNLESGALSSMKDQAALYNYIASNALADRKTYVFLDEIQEVTGWEKALRSLMVDLDVDIYITGSNSNLLSSELATYITGRYIEIPVYPFSFLEFHEAQMSLGLEADTRTSFRRFLEQGGMPFQYELAFETAPTVQYLDGVFNAILLKDMVQRNHFRDVAQLERIVDYAIEQIGHIFSVKNTSDFVKSDGRKISIDTIYSYLRAAEEACLLYRIKREDAVGKRALKYNEKFYLVDQGFRATRGFNNGEAIDQVLENIVFVELLRRGFDVTVGKVGDKEIDFVAKKDGSICYYQVCYLLASGDVVEREFRALELISDNYPKFVLSLDEISRERNGIIHMNMIDWLLDT